MLGMILLYEYTELEQISKKNLEVIEEKTAFEKISNPMMDPSLLPTISNEIS